MIFRGAVILGDAERPHVVIDLSRDDVCGPYGAPRCGSCSECLLEDAVEEDRPVLYLKLRKHETLSDAVGRALRERAERP
jgi:hypothetical protein